MVALVFPIPAAKLGIVSGRMTMKLMLPWYFQLALLQVTIQEPDPLPNHIQFN
jgi:hypothetical protein